MAMELKECIKDGFDASLRESISSRKNMSQQSSRRDID